MKKLTEKNLAFCEQYVANGYNGSAAYAIAYENDNPNTCSTEASKMIKDPLVQEKIKAIEGDYRILGYSMGIDKKLILNILFEQFQATKVTKDGVCKDNIAINNAINTWAKLTGEFAAEKQEIVTTDTSGLDKDPSKLSDEDRERMKQEILKEL